MNKSNINELSAGTEADSNSTAQNQQVSQPNANTNVGRSASSIVDKVLNDHFGTSKKTVECRFYDNGLYQYSMFYHTGHLAWAAGENWKMLAGTSRTKDYEIVE